MQALNYSGEDTNNVVKQGHTIIMEENKQVE
jgi:hypothetical protein